MLLCIGTTPTVQRTLTFDRLRLDQVNRARICDDYASGKSVNVARVAAALGEEVVAAGFVGGRRGRYLVDELSAAGLGHDFVRVAPETRLCTTVIDDAGGTVTELVEESSAVDAKDWTRLKRIVRRHLKSADACVLSGSLPPKADEDFYAWVVEQAARRKVKVVVDARGEPLLRALQHEGFVVKLNREELAATARHALRTETQLRQAMRDACPAGGQVIVTMGGSGALAFDGEQFWTIPTPKIRLVNPIGSGDSFAAGLAVGLVRNLPPDQLYALAAACGAANAEHPRAGHVDPARVRALAKSIRVSKSR